jgi:hypothetical protein
LRSNDQRIVQLDHALAAKGWYLERREGELKTSTTEEKGAIQQRIGHSLEDRTIRLKDGAQSYTATFYGQPEIAKKNVKKIFDSIEDGGYFEKIFSRDMTAEKMIIAHKIKASVDDFAKRFSGVRRRIQKTDDLITAYTPVLGETLSKKHSAKIHQVMPQCSLFVCGTIFKDLVDNWAMDPNAIPEKLKSDGSALIAEHLQYIMDFADENQDKADKSWPVLLKSNTFFNHIAAYIAGIRRGARAPISS